MTRHASRALSRPLLLLAAGSLVGLSAACGGSSAGSPPAAVPAKDGVVVNTGLLSFDPQSVTVKPGQAVTWLGGDNITHVLVEGTYTVGGDGLRTEQTEDNAFSLELTKKGQHVSHTYDKAGTFTYFCTIHKGMNGTVTVS
jgi:plastocyanin